MCVWAGRGEVVLAAEDGLGAVLPTRERWVGGKGWGGGGPCFGGLVSRRVVGGEGPGLGGGLAEL
jgi:hypothetical protein